jgi:hypothetical protein
MQKTLVTQFKTLGKRLAKEMGITDFLRFTITLSAILPLAGTTLKTKDNALLEGLPSTAAFKQLILAIS